MRIHFFQNISARKDLTRSGRNYNKRLRRHIKSKCIFKIKISYMLLIVMTTRFSYSNHIKLFKWYKCLEIMTTFQSFLLHWVGGLKAIPTNILTKELMQILLLLTKWWIRCVAAQLSEALLNRCRPFPVKCTSRFIKFIQVNTFRERSATSGNLGDVTSAWPPANETQC